MDLWDTFGYITCWVCVTVFASIFPKPSPDTRPHPSPPSPFIFFTSMPCFTFCWKHIKYLSSWNSGEDYSPGTSIERQHKISLFISLTNISGLNSNQGGVHNPLQLRKPNLHVSDHRTQLSSNSYLGDVSSSNLIWVKIIFMWASKFSFRIHTTPEIFY